MRLPFELFLALRYLRPKRTFVSVITLLSLLGVTLGVTMLIVVISVMAGFERELREKVIGFTSHITITDYGVITNPVEILAIVEADPDVEAASPFVQGPVLARHEGFISTPIIRAIDPQRESRLLGGNDRIEIIDGTLDLTTEGVAVGVRFAERNQIFPGSRLTLFGERHARELLMRKDNADVVFFPTEVEVTGIFSTGMFDYDANFMLMSLDLGQQLYVLEEGVHGIALRLKDPLAAGRVKERLQPQLPTPLRALTWMDLNEKLFHAIAVERSVMFFILFFIVIVAAFGLCSTLITITVQKQPEIGLLKALGAQDAQILWVFLCHGLVVGMMGSALGLALGATLLRFRNEFSRFLAETFGVEVFPYEIYAFETIPAEINEQIIAAICLSAVLVCALAALVPAFHAARLQPAQALR